MQSIMKKIRKYGIILFAGLCACAAWSCEEDKTDRKFTPKDPVIKLGGDVEVGKAGGSYTVSIESNLPWHHQRHHLSHLRHAL